MAGGDRPRERITHEGRLIGGARLLAVPRVDRPRVRVGARRVVLLLRVVAPGAAE